MRRHLIPLAGVVGLVSAACAPAPTPAPAPDPSPILAVAYSNVDGIDGYNPVADVLIAKLVDSDDDGTASLGDSIVTGRYPLDLSATAFGSFGVTPTAIARLTINKFPAYTEVTAYPLDPFGDRVQFFGGPGYVDRFIDHSSACSTNIADYRAGTNDNLSVNDCSPLLPSTAVPYVSLNRPTDDPFIDVDIFV